MKKEELKLSNGTRRRGETQKFGVYSLSFERRSSYLKTQRTYCRLVIGLPDTNKERNLGIVIASGEWGCPGHQITGPATNAPPMPDLGAPNVEALLAL